jgi:hypothetical protein
VIVPPGVRPDEKLAELDRRSFGPVAAEAQDIARGTARWR